MNEEHRDQYLMHYGVLGMKWGIRRKRKSSEVSRSSGKKVKETSVVEKNQNGEQTKRRMSNDELAERVKRLRLEAEYARLVKETTPGTVSKIDKVINNVSRISKMTRTAVDLYKTLNAAYDIASTVGLVEKKKK